MAGHESIMGMVHPGIFLVTDVQGHGHRAFVRSISVLAERALPPEELTRDRPDEESMRLKTMREVM